MINDLEKKDAVMKAFLNNKEHNDGLHLSYTWYDSSSVISISERNPYGAPVNSINVLADWGRHSLNADYVRIQLSLVTKPLITKY